MQQYFPHKCARNLNDVTLTRKFAGRLLCPLDACAASPRWLSGLEGVSRKAVGCGQKTAYPGCHLAATPAQRGAGDFNTRGVHTAQELSNQRAGGLLKNKNRIRYWKYPSPTLDQMNMCLVGTSPAVCMNTIGRKCRSLTSGRGGV